MKKVILISGIIFTLIGGGLVAEATGDKPVDIQEKSQTIGVKSEARITAGMTTDTGSFVDTTGYERIGVYAKNNTGEKASTAQVIVVDESSGQEIFKMDLQPGEVINEFFVRQSAVGVRAKVMVDGEEHEGTMAIVKALN